MSENRYPASSVASSDGDAQAFISTYLRHLWLFLIVSSVSAALVGGVLLTRPKAYTATATVNLISTDRVQVQPQEGYRPAGENAMAAYVETQVDAIKARDLAARVVDELALSSDPEFGDAARQGAVAGKTEADREATITAVQSHLKVRRTGQTYTVEISFVSASPAKAAHIANQFASTFVRRQTETKVGAAKDANGLIAAQIVPLADELRRVEEAVAQYKAAHGLLSAQGSTLSEQQISPLTQQISLARAAQAEAEARLATAQAQLRAGSAGDDVGEALNSQVVQELRKQRAQLSGKLADLEGRYGPRYPELLATRGQLADLDIQIKAEINRIISNLQAQAQVARERTQSMQRSLNTAQSGLATANTASVQLNELQRSADATRALYEGSLAKAKQTAQQQTVTQPDAAVTAYADTPTAPSAPNQPLAVLVGVVVGLAAGAAAVIFRRLLDSTLRTQDDVESKLGVLYLGGIPTVESSVEKPETKDPIEAILKHPLSGFAEAFRSISTAVGAASRDQAKIIAITSSLPNEGKTTTAICLSEVLAIGGSKVLTIDCDLRRRSLNILLKSDVKIGLLDVLRGNQTVENAVFKDPRSGVHYLLLPRGAVASAASPLDQPGFGDLLARLRETYDYVILDTPPLLPIVDTRRLAAKVDAVVLLCRWQHTPRRAVQHSVRLLQDANAQLSGIALTRINLKAQQRYGYGDSSYYYNGYKDYYLEEQAKS